MLSFRKFALNTVRFAQSRSCILLESRYSSTIKKEKADTPCVSNVLNVQLGQQTVEDVVDFSIHGPSSKGVQGGHDDLLDVVDPQDNASENLPVTMENAESYNCSNNVNLHSCMQTNVPEPFNTDYNHADHYNMPGGGNKLFEKYIQDVQSSHHQNKTYHTSSRHFSAQAQLIPEYEDYELAPQGIQGDDCVNLKLWMECCQRYGLPNCDEQLNNIIEGRKTLAQVFKEQEDLIQKVAETYKQKIGVSAVYNDSIQGLQENDYSSSLNTKDCSIQGVQALEEVKLYYINSPQGIQGDQCVQFKLWLENCNRFGLDVECKDQLLGLQSGRKTLAQIFNEQDALIRKIVLHHYQPGRHYSTASSKPQPEVGNHNSNSQSSQSSPLTPTSQFPENTANDRSKLSQREKLKLLVKEYGSTVMVFHITISLASLGGFYAAVSSGIDVVAMLRSLGVGESILQSRLTTGASTWVIAYAVHKVFAPVRIGITLTVTPFIVKHLKKIGFFKVKPKS